MLAFSQLRRFMSYPCRRYPEAQIHGARNTRAVSDQSLFPHCPLEIAALTKLCHLSLIIAPKSIPCFPLNYPCGNGQARADVQRAKTSSPRAWTKAGYDSEDRGLTTPCGGIPALGVPVLAQWLMNPPSIHKDSGLLAGLTQQVKDPTLP